MLTVPNVLSRSLPHSRASARHFEGAKKPAFTVKYLGEGEEHILVHDHLVDNIVWAGYV